MDVHVPRPEKPFETFALQFLYAEQVKPVLLCKSTVLVFSRY